MRRNLLPAMVTVLVAGMVACSTNTATTQSSSPAGSSPSANPCSPPPVKTAGTLTVGTSYPYYEPFKKGPKDNPTGFEPDVAHAIAQQLGLANVAWSIAPFESLYAPGPKAYDLSMDEISFTDERAKVVDFSDPYYTIQQGLLVRTGTPIASAHTIADLKPYHFGAQAGTTGLAYIKDTIKPAKVSEYNDTVTAGQALSLGQIDAVVIDVPIAIPMTKQFTNTTVIGQFLTNETYNMALVKGSPLVTCVNQGLAAMTAAGTLKTITDTWFPGTTADIPVFQ